MGEPSKSNLPDDRRANDAPGRSARPDVWGCWRFVPENLTLLFQEGGDEYEIDLEGIDTSAEMLD